MALFPAWSDSALRVGIVIAAALGVAAVVAPMIYMRTPYNTGQENPPDQPVAFDHRHHVQDDGIDCRYCHSTVERTPYASLPATEVCMGCHNQVWSGSPMLEPVRASQLSGAPIPWNRVHWLPGFVYFHHAIHVRRFACERCHDRVDRMAVVYQAQPLTMGWCLDCHRKNGPARLTDCTTCHR